MEAIVLRRKVAHRLSAVLGESMSGVSVCHGGAVEWGPVHWVKYTVDEGGLYIGLQRGVLVDKGGAGVFQRGDVDKGRSGGGGTSTLQRGGLFPKDAGEKRRVRRVRMVRNVWAREGNE